MTDENLLKIKMKPSAERTHIHKLCGEFKGGRFEAKVFGRAGQDEAEVDVNDVTFSVQ